MVRGEVAYASSESLHDMPVMGLDLLKNHRQPRPRHLRFETDRGRHLRTVDK